MIDGLPPFVLFLVGAVLIPFLRGWARYALLLALPVVGGLHLLTVPEGQIVHIDLLGYQFTPYRADRLSLLFGYLFHLAAFLSIIFSLHVRDTLQHVAGLLYVGSALGAVFAGDLITLFVFWELLAITSVFLIWARRTPRAIAAGFRYLVIQVFSGLILLAGVLVHVQQTGSIAFEYMGLNSPASWLIFLAFGFKSAFPLLHNWLTDAYPEATPTGTVFLSAFTTKVAVYALARAFPGTEVLIYIGAVMTCFPVFFAVIENDLRRVLSYSMINQIGFMVCGIGIGTHLAINGAVSHAFNDVIFKGLLFMTMGAVLHMTGRIKGSELGGLYKTMPITTGFCIVGAASISAFPLFSGFVSKSMVMTAALEEGYHWVWIALLFASAGVFHHAGIKIPFFAFYAKDSGIRVSEPPLNMLIAMGLAAVLCVFIGSYPWLLYGLLPFPVDYQPYDGTHVIAQLQLLFFSALAFTWLKLSGLYPPELPSVNLDSEWVYRWLAPRFIRKTAALGSPLDVGLRRSVVKRVEAVIDALFRYHGPQGVLARTWATGSMVLWVAILLGVYLIFYYL
ncbi:MAG: Na(+)/H(+) antiporter subunit D [Gammaproteobacteria bacterium]|nr:Na(+)/H(+) antiporter subunit D [Gammaproteobacteria bacterium]